uniref:Uncharacterized protein n=1 Tax=Acrobeloides nanus TaxID=290746 RepID=A0A914DW53_9BILA
MGYSEENEYEVFVGNMPINVNNNNSPNFAIIVFVIVIGALIFLVFSAIGIFCCYRILCSRTNCSTDDMIIESFPIIECPLTPRPESFRRNSAQAQLRLLLQSKYEQEYGNEQKCQPVWYSDGIPEGEIV